ncbi:MAG: type II toxin-antitoxin system HicB family antitoxin [Euryarchaeota archaeon]|nr:type II toxin-antitoxin system HicB family antitoxin [Euryarchaeota archaeon]
MCKIIRALCGIVAVLLVLCPQGRSIAETMEIAQDVARKPIESYVEHGDPLPYEIEPSKNVMQDVKIPLSVTA